MLTSTNQNLMMKLTDSYLCHASTVVLGTLQMFVFFWGGGLLTCARAGESNLRQTSSWLAIVISPFGRRWIYATTQPQPRGREGWEQNVVKRLTAALRQLPAQVNVVIAAKLVAGVEPLRQTFCAPCAPCESRVIFASLRADMLHKETAAEWR